MAKVEIIGTTFDIKCTRCKRKKAGIFTTTSDNDSFCHECLDREHVQRLFISDVKDMKFLGSEDEKKKDHYRNFKRG